MMTNYEYTTNALILKKEVDGLKITLTAELPCHLNPDEALDKVLDAMMDITDRLPAQD